MGRKIIERSRELRENTYDGVLAMIGINDLISGAESLATIEANWGTLLTTIAGLNIRRSTA